MTITVRSSNGTIEYFTATSSTSQTVNLSDAAIDDVRVLVCNFSPDGTGTVPSHPSITGWTQIGTSTATGAASDSRLSIYYRVVQSGDTLTSATLAITLNNTATVGSICVTLEGVDTDDVLDAVVPSFVTGSAPATCPSITTITDDAWVGHVGIQDATSGAYTDGVIPSGDTLLGTMANNPPSNGMNLGFSYEIQATAGATGTAAYTNSGTEEIVAATFAIKNFGEGITSVSPDSFNMRQANIEITITGAGFGATQGTGTVYISTADTIAGDDNLVDIDAAITSWSDTSITVNLIFLNDQELNALQVLGPGARYVIVSTNGAVAEYSNAITLSRPSAFIMAPSSGFAAGTTTAQLTAPATKTTGDMDGGRIEETANPSATTTDVTADDYREDEWCITRKVYARKVAYEFRVVYGGVVGTISQTPAITFTQESGIKVRVAAFSLRTTNGTQDVTITDLGSASNIKGALFFCSNAVVLDTVAAHARHSLGGSDKTSTFNIFSGNEDNVSTTDVERKSHNNGIAIFLSDEAATTLVSVTIDSWITNGVRLDVTNPSSNAYKGYIVFFADSGSDLEIDASWQAMDNANDVDITTIGFEPEVIFSFSNGLNTNNSRTIDVKSSQGMLHNTGGVARQPQAALGLNQENALTTTTEVSYVSDDSFILKLEDAIFDTSAHAKDFDSSGFTVEPLNLNIGTNFQYFLSITTNGKIPLGLAQFTGPTSASVDWELLDTSITPQAVVAVQTACTVINSLRSTDEISSSAYAFDRDGAQASIGLASDSGETTVSNTCSFASTANTLWLRRDDQTADFHLAGDPSIVPGGFKFPASEITTADSTARYGFALIFGEGIAVAATSRTASATATATVTATGAVSSTIERTSTASAAGTATSSALVEISRASAASATATVTSVQFNFSVLSRSSSVSSTVSVLATSIREVPRGSVSSATATVTAVSESASIVSRAAVVSATTLVIADRFVEILRVSSVSSTASASSSQINFSVLSRSASVSAAAIVASTQLNYSVFPRTAAVLALGSISSAGQVGGEVTRSSSSSAVGFVSSSAISERLRTASSFATGSVSVIAESGGIITRSAIVAGIGSVDVTANRETLRSASVIASGSILVLALTERLRSPSAGTVGQVTALSTTERLRTSTSTASATVSVVYFLGEPSATSDIIVGNQMIAQSDDTAFPIEVAVSEGGGVVGLNITIAIRDVENSSSYLDFSDNTFKTSGWTSQTQALAGFGGGFYGTNLNIAALSGLTDEHMAVEYDISGAVVGISHSTLTIDSKLPAVNSQLSSIEGTYDHQESMRLILAALAGQLSGAATTEVTIRDTSDTKDRIVATVDSNGNRTAVTLDAS